MSELAQTRRTFYEIADDLSTYFETVAMAEQQLAGRLTDAERVEIEDGRKQMLAQIERLGSELATKAEATAGVLRRLKSEAELISAEEMKLTERRLVIERAEEWLKHYVIAAMNNAGTRVVKTPTVTLRIQGNGGVQPLIISDVNAVPDEFKDVGVTMPLPIFRQLVEPAIERINSDYVRILATEVSQKRIREALANGPVPGAHLEPRGEHLRIV